MDVHNGGEVRVEVLGEDGKLIRGFELSGRVRLRGNGVDQVVHWHGEADWARLAGTKVSLRIQLRNADLYALWTDMYSN